MRQILSFIIYFLFTFMNIARSQCNGNGKCKGQGDNNGAGDGKGDNNGQGEGNNSAFGDDDVGDENNILTAHESYTKSQIKLIIICVSILIISCILTIIWWCYHKKQEEKNKPQVTIPVPDKSDATEVMIATR
eukprot:417261_1